MSFQRSKVMALLLLVAMLTSIQLGGSALTAGDYEEKDLTFSVFVWVDDEEFAMFKDPNESVVVKEYLKAYKEKTGRNVTLDFWAYPGSTASSALTLMLADGNYPDMIWYNVGNKIYPGAPDTLYDDGVLVDLEEMLPQHAPHFTALVSKFPESFQASMRTAKGRMFHFGSCLPDIDETTGAMARLCFWGPVVRTDLLEATGLKAEDINTFDDFTNLLRKLKENGVEIPFEFAYGSGWALGNNTKAMLGGFGQGYSYSFEPGTQRITNGFIGNGYRQWLELIHQWYQEGLINPNFLTCSYPEDFIANFSSGKAGAAIMHAFHTIYYYQSYVKDHPEATLTALKLPVTEEMYAAGQIAVVRDMYGDSLTGRPKMVTTACKDVEEAIRFIDFQYTDEMILLANFGVEGISFEYVDGKPEYTPLWYENRDMFFYYQSLWLCGQFMNEQLAGDYKLPVQQDSVFGKWSNVGDEGFAANLPNSGIVFTAEEQEAYTRIQTELDVHIGESRADFILNGVTDEGWEQYIKTCKELGIDETIALYQAAYDRLKALK